MKLSVRLPNIHARLEKRKTHPQAHYNLGEESLAAPRAARLAAPCTPPTFLPQIPADPSMLRGQRIAQLNWDCSSSGPAPSASRASTREGLAHSRCASRSWHMFLKTTRRYRGACEVQRADWRRERL